MGRYRWDGGQPHITDDGQVFRPTEVYEFDEEPDFGPFTLIPPDDPENAPEPPQAAPTPPPAAAAAPRSPAATPPPAAVPSTGSEGA